MCNCQHCASSELFTNRSLNQFIRSTTTTTITLSPITSPPSSSLTHCQHWQLLRRSPVSYSSSRSLLQDTPVVSDQHSDSIHFHSPTNADHSTSHHSPLSSAAPTNKHTINQLSANTSRHRHADYALTCSSACHISASE